MKDTRTEMVKEINTRVVQKFVNGDFAFGNCRQLLPKDPITFLKKVLSADGLLKYFIRQKQ